MRHNVVTIDNEKWPHAPNALRKLRSGTRIDDLHPYEREHLNEYLTSLLCGRTADEPRCKEVIDALPARVQHHWIHGLGDYLLGYVLHQRPRTMTRLGVTYVAIALWRLRSKPDTFDTYRNLMPEHLKLRIERHLARFERGSYDGVIR